MKKQLLLLLLLVAAGARAQEFDYTVNVHLSAVKEPVNVYLVYSFGWTNQRVLDSAVLQNGRCVLHGKAEELLKTDLVVTHQHESIGQYIKNADLLTLYLEKGPIHVQGTDSIKNAVITGFPLNKEYNAYRSVVLEPAAEAKHRVDAAFMAAPETARHSRAFLDSLMQLMKIALYEQDSLAWVYVRQHPDEDLSLLVLNELAGNTPDVPVVEPVFRSLSDRLRNTSSGKKLAALLYDTGPTAVGAMAPDFMLNDVHDRPVKLSDFRGKYVLLDFWASWCSPCRAENPYVVKAYQAYKAKNFTVLGVSLDQPGKKDAWLQAIQKDGLDWTQVSDLKYWNSAAAQLYNVKAIPQNFLIDPQGKIIAKNLRGETLEKRLATLLAEQ